MPEFPALADAAVTVPDLTASTAWYSQLFGIHTHSPGGATAFDATNPGLDHLASACADRPGLATWAARLDELGVRHGGVVDAHHGSGVSFTDPDGIALEFLALPVG